MSDLHPYMPSVIRARMQTHRKRKVGYTRVNKGVSQYFGHFETAPFERLYNGCPQPWQVRMHWTGPQSQGLNKRHWFETLDAALTKLVADIDSHRLYPSEIEVRADSVWLLKDGQPVFSLEPLSFDEPDPATLAKCRTWLHEDSARDPVAFVAKLATLPGLENLYSPLYAPREWPVETKRRTAPGEAVMFERSTYLQSTGLLEFEPVSAAQTVLQMYADQNIHVSLEVARADLAYYFGFESWGALLLQWAQLPVFDPVSVQDNRTGRALLYRSALHALAALPELVTGLDEQYAWRLNMGPFIGRLDAAVVRTRNLETRDQDVLIAIQGREATRWGETLSPEANLRNPEGLRTYLTHTLGTDLPPAAQVALTNRRRRATTQMAGPVLVSRVKSDSKYGGSSYMEVLRADGWQDVSVQEKLFDPRSPWEYRDGPRTGTDHLALQLGRTPKLGLSHGKDFCFFALLPGATAQQLDGLKALFELSPHEKLAGRLEPPAMDPRGPSIDVVAELDAGMHALVERIASFKPYSERLEHRLVSARAAVNPENARMH